VVSGLAVARWQAIKYARQGRRHYYAMLKLDGTPVHDRERGEGYDAWAPYGHVDLWKTTIYSYEFRSSPSEFRLRVPGHEIRDGSSAARTAGTANCWARIIEPSCRRRWGVAGTRDRRAIPVRGQGWKLCEDTGARFRSSFSCITRRAKRNRALACRIARDAVEQLWAAAVSCHPAKPYYEATKVWNTAACVLGTGTTPQRWSRHSDFTRSLI